MEQNNLSLIEFRNANVVCISCTKRRSIFLIPISPGSHCYVSALLKHMDDCSCTIKQISMSIFYSCLPNRANFVDNLLLLFEFMPYMMIGGLEIMKNIPYWKIQCCGNDILWSLYSDGVAVVTYKHIHYLWSKLQIIPMESLVEEMAHTMQQFKGIFTYLL